MISLKLFKLLKINFEFWLYRFAVRNGFVIVIWIEIILTYFTKSIQ